MMIYLCHLSSPSVFNLVGRQLDEKVTNRKRMAISAIGRYNELCLLLTKCRIGAGARVCSGPGLDVIVVTVLFLHPRHAAHSGACCRASARTQPPRVVGVLGIWIIRSYNTTYQSHFCELQISHTQEVCSEKVTVYGRIEYVPS